MKKIIFKILFISTVLLFSLILYLEIFGIKTSRFNSKIISHIEKIKPGLEIRLDDVSAKLDIFNFSIDIKTLGTELILREKIIKLESIKSKISLKSIIENEFILTQVFVSTNSLPIKDLISFIRIINNDPKLFIIDQFISQGYIIANFELEFDEFGKIKDNYKLKGQVNNGQISLLKKKLTKLNLNYQITENELKFDNIDLLVNNKKIFVPEITALKKKKDFQVSGKLLNKNSKFNEKEIKEYFKDKFINLKEIEFSSKSNFSFNIDKKLRFKNFNIKSVINLDYLKFNNFTVLSEILPNNKDILILKNQKVELAYNDKTLNITGSGTIFLQEEPDTIRYEIINNKKGFIFNSNLKINNNPFIINLLNYEKEKNSKLDLAFKGKLNNKELIINEFLISENKNRFLFEDLKLSKNYKLNEIGNIKINYTDKENLFNKLQIIKEDKNYKIIGESFNINQIVTQLLNDKKDDNKDLLNKNFDFLFDIKKIYLDKKNSAYNLKGYLSIIDNKIVDLNLESEFSNQQKMKFTVKASSNNEKITTLFSNQAKPLVDRYKFIKGFEEGKLDFYSIKKKDQTNSNLKIYNFKLKELPALTKLLTLASLQGIADLLSGEGIRFDEFEMNFTNSNNLLTINEIYAIGPAISILMEGYIEKYDLISLRGTLVPATTINKTISSIPLLGDILVGKKIGEGVFGVSFKIKGPPKNLETSVNPIKTLTPRFITRTLEKIKKN